jgi:hypothetical protein
MTEDTSFTPELYEREIRHDRHVSNSKKMAAINHILDVVAPRMPTHIRSSPRIQEWIELLRAETDETDEARSKRMWWEYQRIFGGPA